jgi:hypothetical protein
MTDDQSNPTDDRRGRETRRTALKSARIIHPGGTVECKVRNISDGGARLELAGQQLLPHTFELEISGLPTRQCSLRWARGNLVGVQFVD